MTLLSQHHASLPSQPGIGRHRSSVLRLIHYSTKRLCTCLFYHQNGLCHFFYLARKRWWYILHIQKILIFFSWIKNFEANYRVSHSKEVKVVLLWWGYRFWFLLIFWVLHVHEIDPSMPNSSVFIFMMSRALYRMTCKSSKKILKKRVWMHQM